MQREGSPGLDLGWCRRRKQQPLGERTERICQKKGKGQINPDKRRAGAELGW